MRKALTFICLFSCLLLKSQDITGAWKIDSFIVTAPVKSVTERIMLSLVMDNSPSEYSIIITQNTLTMMSDGKVEDSFKIMKKKSSSSYLLKSIQTRKTSTLLVKQIQKDRCYFAVDDKMVYVVRKIKS